MASTTMNDLFADDSSSDDESVGAPTEMKQTSEAEAPAPDAADKATDDSKDDEDDKMEIEETPNVEETQTEGGEKPDAEVEKPAESTAEEEKKPAEEDEDDDDVEFNDAEADIVGEKAAPTVTTPTSPSKQQQQDRPTPSGRSKEPLVMRVLESTRPPSGVTMHMTKLPGMLVGIQPEAFDESTYSAKNEEMEFQNVHNMIRWRYKQNAMGELERDDNGKLVRESNARIVQWDNGSYTLHVGSEVFEVDSLKTATNTGFAGINGYLYQSQKAQYVNKDESTTPGGTVLESMGRIESKLTARPSSLQSEAHKNLTVAVRQRNMKKARIAEYVTQHDPEKEKAERIKIKQELDKVSARKNKAQRQRRTPGMNRRYMEEEEDDGRYDSVNIGALKRRRDDLEEDYDFGDDSEDEEDDWAAQKLARNKRRRGGAEKEEEEEKEDDVVFGDDSSEEEEQIHRVKAPAKKRSAVLEDEDDD